MEPSSKDDRKKQLVKVLSGLMPLMTYLLIFSFFVGDIVTSELIWVCVMLGSAVLNILGEKDTFYMKWMVVFSIILLFGDVVVYLVIPQIGLDYNSIAIMPVVAVAGTFIRALMIVTYFHEFFDSITNKVVSFLKSGLGMR